MARTLKVLVALTVFATMFGAQSAARKPMEGVWKVAEIVVTGADASNVANPQPSLFIFAKSHYSMMLIPGNEPRTLFKGEEPTNQEKMSAFDSFVANTGTYEVTGSTLTIRPIVARYPNFMAGGFSKYQFQMDGNTLWLTEKSTDLHHRIGKRVVPSSAPVSETRLKLVRVE